MCGFPGETGADWDEFYNLYLEYKKYNQGKYLIANMHAVNHMPATPLGILSINEDYEQYCNDFFEKKNRVGVFTNRFYINKPKNNANRIKESIIANACSADDLKEGFKKTDNPNSGLNLDKVSLSTRSNSIQFSFFLF